MTKRNFNIDLLRGIAAFGIVGCHLALLPLSRGGWFVRELCDMNVGLFAALSGFLMCSFKMSDAASSVAEYGQYVMRRVRRLVPVYALWTVLFFLFGLVFDYFVRHGLNPKLTRLDYWPKVVFLGGISTQLWFLPCLLYAQVIFWPLQRVARTVTGWGWLFVGLATVWCATRVGGWFGCYPLRLFAFLVSGFGLRCVLEKLQLRASWTFCVVGLMIGFHYATEGVVPTFVRDWLVAIPLLAAFSQWDLPPRFRGMAECLGMTSMGVFLIHPVFAAGFGLFFRKFFAAPYGPVPELLDWLLCWGCSFTFACFIRRFQPLRCWIQ